MIKNLKVIRYEERDAEGNPIILTEKDEIPAREWLANQKSQNKVTFMCIDEGLAGTGIAIWNEGELYPVFHKSFTYKKDTDYMDMIAELIDLCGVSYVFCEDVAYHGTGSVAGQAAAESGSLVKLSKFAGSLRGYIYGRYNGAVEYKFVPVVTWKGQLPKDVVKNRILKVLPAIKTTNHDWDAVGIGLYIMDSLHAKQSNHKDFLKRSRALESSF